MKKKGAWGTAEDLKAAPYNPRTVKPEKLELLGRQMANLGDLGGITYNVRTGTLVTGHQRVANLPPGAAIVMRESLDEPDAQGTVGRGFVRDAEGGEWAVRFVDVDLFTEMAMNLASNRPAGEFVLPAVAEMVSELDANGFEAELAGFTSGELEALLSWTPPAAGDGGTPEPGEHEDRSEAYGKDVRVTIGEIRFTVPVERYHEWMEEVRQAVGFDDESIIRELRQRLCV